MVILFCIQGGMNVQLKKTTDYAIRIVFFLSRQNRVFTSEEISKATGVSKNYIMQILRRLADAGILKIIRGSKGGFRINKKPSGISLFDVIKAMESTININQCLDQEENCNLYIAGHCPVRKFYISLQEQMESELKVMTFETLKKSGEGLDSS